jgi:pimeloyl-ACP methyl ester carboxylesterase
MEVITQIQGDEDSHLTPLFLIHAISGLALPFLRLESLCSEDRPVFGVTSPMHCHGGESWNFPTSLPDLAAFYVRLIKKIQPDGPYLLGGWSMGGMIAMNMAHILLEQGEDVLKVIMIDSANPEAFPAFQSPEDHRALTRLTFSKTVAAGLQISAGMNLDSPIVTPAGSESDADDYFGAPPERTDTWGTSSTGFTSSSGSSIDYEDDTSRWSPTSKLSPNCSSDDESDSEGDDEEDSESDSESEEDENEPPQLREYLQKIKTHIHKGLNLISAVKPGQILPKAKPSPFHAVLIKCSPEPSMPAQISKREKERATFIRDIMRETAMRWDASRFTKFETIPFSGDHDGAFEPRYVGELSDIIRNCLVDLE